MTVVSTVSKYQSVGPEQRSYTAKTTSIGGCGVVNTTVKQNRTLYIEIILSFIVWHLIISYDGILNLYRMNHKCTILFVFLNAVFCAE